MGFWIGACKKEVDGNNSNPPDAPANKVTPEFVNLSVTTDKAIYNPGENVIFALENSILPATAKVRYKNLDSVLSESAVTGPIWTWTVPNADYKGYIAEVYASDNDNETIYATIGIDVSSDWKKFPRYGFLSKFPNLSNEDVNTVINNLNRYHINGIQFYDWQYKHHKPLPVTGSTPASTWKDIINRDIYFSTVEKYINSAHMHNMKAMFYNLIYGAWKDAESDEVNKEWYIYTNSSHTNKDYHPLSTPPFLSNIYLLDPSNTEWQNYLINENKKVYMYLDFDGFHMDQLGDRGTRYRYDGTLVTLSLTFKLFIDAVKADESKKDIVMNAVNQYGQKEIAEASTDFLYTEVWKPYESYNDLANLIKQNNAYSNNTKNTVLAAYMNYDLAENKGYFNTPSVLMTDAVIFAFGGAHLELGEHMLGKEYFPNDNLAMKEDLKTALKVYYDFLVAYQNLLRNGGDFNTVSVSSLDSKMKIVKWPSSQGSVASVGKKVGNSQVIHLINFKDSKTTSWRDNRGVQVSPTIVKDAKLTLTCDGTVKKMWIASPDIIGGASRSVNFAQKEDKVSFTLPELKYWTMIVVEY